MVNITDDIIAPVYNKTIRQHLPRKLAYMNGYVVRSPRLLDKNDVREGVQSFEVGAHEEQTQKGDTVVIVGGGNGVSTLAAAEAVGSKGKVIVFEASSDLAPALRETMELNDFDDRVEVHSAVVGKPGEKIWGTSKGSKVLPATEMPEMDVLELDCEGAELKILTNLPHRPRVLTVESHPNFGIDPDDIRTWLTNEGYEIDKESSGIDIHHTRGINE